MEAERTAAVVHDRDGEPLVAGCEVDLQPRFGRIKCRERIARIEHSEPARGLTETSVRLESGNVHRVVQVDAPNPTDFRCDLLQLVGQPKEQQ